MPMVAPAAADAPVPDAPRKATTVSDCAKPPISCCEMTIASTSGAGAIAVQISDEPNCVFARCRRVQSRPAPVTTNVCGAVVGPSDAANATSSSPATAVLKAGVTTVPSPSTETTLSTARVAAAGPDEITSATALPTRTGVPPTGAWLITDPAGTVAL